MTKKRKAAKSKVGAKKKKHAKKVATLFRKPAAGAITIGVGNTIAVVPDPISLNPDSDLYFIVVNQEHVGDDGVDHDVWIDPGKVVNKGTGKKEDPFALAPGHTHVPAGEKKVLRLKMKPKYATPNVTFKYTVESSAPNGPTNSLDPDLDVIDPRASGRA